jgi:hypothetical protein
MKSATSQTEFSPAKQLLLEKRLQGALNVASKQLTISRH